MIIAQRPTYRSRQASAGRPERQSGVTLIEILITLLVLAIGLLGLAALQGFSLQAGQVSYLRTQATNFAYEVADHARANRSAIEASGNVPNAGFWSARAASLLPQGTVATSVSGDNVLSVSVEWVDERDTGATLEFSFETRL